MKRVLSLASLLFLGQAVADSTLDWYNPKTQSGSIYCVDDSKNYLECNEFGTKVATDIANGIVDHCKSASCSGSFSAHTFNIEVDAVFIPEAKDELVTQVHNIMKKMHKTDPEAIGQTATLAKISFPQKMILNRHADDSEQGHMTITITEKDTDGLCAALTAIQAVGGTIPEVGAFFGLISIADC